MRIMSRMVMRFFSVRWVGCWCITAVMSFGSQRVLAQAEVSPGQTDAAGDAADNAGESAPSPATGNGNAAPAAPSAAAQPAVNNEDADKGRAAVAEMKDILAQVFVYASEAREERDVVKLNCVNEKLTAIKGLLKISEAAEVALQDGLAAGAADTARHELEKISIARRKTEEHLHEAEACVGELAVYSGNTIVELEIDSEVLGGEEKAGDIPVIPEEGLDILRPPVATPFQ